MRRFLLPVLVLATAACSDSNTLDVPPPTPGPTPPEPGAIFEVRVVNLTPGQPLSPLALVLHDSDVRPFTIGEPASAGLEVLAEAGDNSEFLDEVAGRAEVSGAAPLGPGATESLTIELDDANLGDTRLSLVAMLVNTNDALAGVNSLDVSGFVVGDAVQIDAISYDAGTEANNELGGTIPGPADGGEGFNALRDDVRDQVTMHGGVVTGDDGLSPSVLDQTHRFDNPVARVVITRTR